MALLEEIVNDYKTSLADLHVNSKPLINMLTMLAEENEQYAPDIVKVIEDHVKKVKPTRMLSVLYLIDSIIKNLQKSSYKSLFMKNIVHTFTYVFEQVDEKTRASMYKLRQTWTTIFPNPKLYGIDVRINNLFDPAWPITATAPEQTSIHVNPKFLPQLESDPTPEMSPEPDPDKDEEESEADLEKQESLMRQQLIAKQQELLKLQQARLELELLETKEKLKEQKKKAPARTVVKPSIPESTVPAVPDEPLAPPPRDPRLNRDPRIKSNRDPRARAREPASSQVSSTSDTHPAATFPGNVPQQHFPPGSRPLPHMNRLPAFSGTFPGSSAVDPNMQYGAGVGHVPMFGGMPDNNAPGMPYEIAGNMAAPGNPMFSGEVFSPEHSHDATRPREVSNLDIDDRNIRTENYSDNDMRYSDKDPRHLDGASRHSDRDLRQLRSGDGTNASWDLGLNQLRDARFTRNEIGETHPRNQNRPDDPRQRGQVSTGPRSSANQQQENFNRKGDHSNKPGLKRDSKEHERETSRSSRSPRSSKSSTDSRESKPDLSLKDRMRRDLDTKSKGANQSGNVVDRRRTDSDPHRNSDRDTRKADFGKGRKIGETDKNRETRNSRDRDRSPIRSSRSGPQFQRGGGRGGYTDRKGSLRRTSEENKQRAGRSHSKENVSSVRTEKDKGKSSSSDHKLAHKPETAKKSKSVEKMDTDGSVATSIKSMKRDLLKGEKTSTEKELGPSASKKARVEETVSAKSKDGKAKVGVAETEVIEENEKTTGEVVFVGVTDVSDTNDELEQNAGVEVADVVGKIQEDISELFGGEDQDYRQTDQKGLPLKSPSSKGWDKYKASQPDKFALDIELKKKREDAQKDMIESEPQDTDYRVQPQVSWTDQEAATPAVRERRISTLDEVKIPNELSMDHHGEIIIQAHRQLQEGNISHDQHQELLKQLQELMHIQKLQEQNRRLSNEWQESMQREIPQPAVGQAAPVVPEPVMVLPQPEPLMVLPQPETVMVLPEPLMVLPQPEPLMVLPQPEPLMVLPQPEPLMVLPQQEPLMVLPQPEPAIEAASMTKLPEPTIEVTASQVQENTSRSPLKSPVQKMKSPPEPSQGLLPDGDSEAKDVPIQSSTSMDAIRPLPDKIHIPRIGRDSSPRKNIHQDMERKGPLQDLYPEDRTPAHSHSDPHLDRNRHPERHSAERSPLTNAPHRVLLPDPVDVKRSPDPRQHDLADSRQTRHDPPHEWKSPQDTGARQPRIEVQHDRPSAQSPPPPESLRDSDMRFDGESRNPVDTDIRSERFSHDRRFEKSADLLKSPTEGRDRSAGVYRNEPGDRVIDGPPERFSPEHIDRQGPHGRYDDRQQASYRDDQRSDKDDRWNRRMSEESVRLRQEDDRHRMREMHDPRDVRLPDTDRTNAPPFDDAIHRRPSLDAPHDRPPILDAPHDRPPILDAPHDRPPLLDTPHDRPPISDTPHDRPSILDTPDDRPPVLDGPHDRRPPIDRAPDRRPPLLDAPEDRPPLLDDPEDRRPPFEAPLDRREHDGIPDRRPPMDGPPDRRPRFDGRPDGRQPFNSPPDKRDFDGRLDIKPPFDGPPDRRLHFDGPPDRRENFDGPPDRRPPFDGPPDRREPFEGQSDRSSPFEGHPDRREPFEGHPDRREPFDGPPNRRLPFDGPPDRREHFEGRPDGRPPFDGPSDRRPPFDGHPDRRPPFDGPPDRSHFDGPLDRPPFDGPPDRRHRYDDSHWRRPDSPPDRKPFNRDNMDQQSDDAVFERNDRRRRDGQPLHDNNEAPNRSSDDPPENQDKHDRDHRDKKHRESRRASPDRERNRRKGDGRERNQDEEQDVDPATGLPPWTSASPNKKDRKGRLDRERRDRQEKGKLASGEDRRRDRRNEPFDNRTDFKDMPRNRPVKGARFENRGAPPSLMDMPDIKPRGLLEQQRSPSPEEIKGPIIQSRPPFGQPGPPQGFLPPPGPDGPMGPMHDGPRGPMHDAPRGLILDGPRGPILDGPRGPMHDGPRGPMHDGPRGPMHDGPRGPMHDGPRGPMHDGPRGPMHDGPRGPMTRGPMFEPRGPMPDMPRGPQGPMMGPRGPMPDRFMPGPRGPIPIGPDGLLLGARGPLPEGQMMPRFPGPNELMPPEHLLVRQDSEGDPRWMSFTDMSPEVSEEVVIGKRNYAIKLGDRPRTIPFANGTIEVYADPSNRGIVIDGQLVYKFNERVKDVTIRNHTEKVFYHGRPMDLWIDGHHYEVRVDSPPKAIFINSRQHRIQIDGRDMMIILDKAEKGKYGGEPRFIFLDEIRMELRFDPPPKHIIIDGKLCELKLNLKRPCVNIEGKMHGIRFDGPPREMFINNQCFLVPMDRAVKVKVGPRPYFVAFGGPCHEFIVDGKWFEMKFNEAPKEIMVGNRQLMVRFPGGPPDVKILPEIPFGPNGQPLPGFPLPGQMLPGQLLPGQMLPGQLLPGQMLPGQLLPGQPIPGQMLPGQLLHGQQLLRPPLPGQPLPGQLLPGAPMMVPPVMPQLAPPVSKPLLLPGFPGPAIAPRPGLEHQPIPAGSSVSDAGQPATSSQPTVTSTGDAAQPAIPASSTAGSQDAVPTDLQTGEAPPPVSSAPGVPNILTGLFPNPSSMAPGMDISSLFTKLIATGIIKRDTEDILSAITRNATTVKKEPIFEKPSEYNEVPEVERQPTPEPQINTETFDDIPDMTEFEVSQMKILAPGSIQQLYTGVQCNSCGTRFWLENAEKMEKYRQHLDWHFRQNKRDKDEIKVAKYRKWYYGLNDWLQYEEVNETEDQSRSNFFDRSTTTTATPAPATTPFPMISVPEGVTVIRCPPATGNDNEDLCDICHEQFEQYWEEDKEEWHLRDAIRIADRTFHPICYEDHTDISEGTPSPSVLNITSPDFSPKKHLTYEEASNDGPTKHLTYEQASNDGPTKHLTYEEASNDGPTSNIKEEVTDSHTTGEPVITNFKSEQFEPMETESGPMDVGEVVHSTTPDVDLTDGDVQPEIKSEPVDSTESVEDDAQVVSPEHIKSESVDSTDPELSVKSEPPDDTDVQITVKSETSEDESENISSAIDVQYDTQSPAQVIATEDDVESTEYSPPAMDTTENIPTESDPESVEFDPAVNQNSELQILDTQEPILILASPMKGQVVDPGQGLDPGQVSEQTDEDEDMPTPTRDERSPTPTLDEIPMSTTS